LAVISWESFIAMNVEQLYTIFSASFPQIKLHSIPLLVFRTGRFEYIPLNNHRLQHIQNRHHLPLRLPEECVSYACIKAAESFEQLAEMGFKLRADGQE
jgi:hypothetical protein